MKRLISLFFISFLFSGTAIAQQIIEEAGIQLGLPSDQWKLEDHQSRGNMHVYYFKRSPILDKQNRQVIANISVIVEETSPELDVVTYSIQKRGKAYFQVDDMFTHESGRLQFINAVGYKGRYNDQFGEHTIYAVHALHDNKGIQIYCDVLTGLFKHLDSEFQSTLKSIIPLEKES